MKLGPVGAYEYRVFQIPAIHHVEGEHGTSYYGVTSLNEQVQAVRGEGWEILSSTVHPAEAVYHGTSNPPGFSAILYLFCRRVQPDPA